MIFDYSFLDLLLEPTFVINAKGAVIYLNPIASTMLDLSPRRIMSAEHFLDIVSLSTDFPELRILHEWTEPVGYRELDYKSVTGKTGRIQMALQPHVFGGITNWIIYFRDVSLESSLHEKYKNESRQKEKYTKMLEKAHVELSSYSENLENMVEERTRELRVLNTTMRALLDSLDEGFFIVNRQGLCSPVYSKSCEILMNGPPANKKFWEVINAPQDTHETTQQWLESLMNEAIPFKDLAELGPEKVFNSGDKSISLSYFPIYNTNNKIDSIVVVATDKTELELAEKTAKREQAYSRMVINVIRRKKEITRFIFDVQKLLEELSRSVSSLYTFQMKTALRCLHTIKGGAATFAIIDLAQSCHETEQYLIEVQKEGLAKDSLAVLNDYFNRVRYEFQTFLKSNELLLGNEVIHGKRSVEVPLETLEHLLLDLHNDPRLVEKVKAFEKDIFYIPINQFLEGFQETAMALAMKVGKKLKPMIIEGGETLIHREHYSELFTTLIHQLNNMVDHGIEDPVLRRFHHKEEQGQIHIKINIEQSDLPDAHKTLVLQFIDDGQGLDPLALRERLRSKGIITDQISDDEVLQYIFNGNLTTRDFASEVSGRGIGMEAIKHIVMDLGGTVRIDSVPLKGAVLTIKVPYITEQTELISEKWAA